MTAPSEARVHALRWDNPYFSWTIFGAAMMALVASRLLPGSAWAGAWVSPTLLVLAFALVFVGHWVRTRSRHTQVQRALWAASVIGTITLGALIALMTPQGWLLVGVGMFASAVLWLAPIAIDRWVSSPGK